MKTSGTGTVRNRCRWSPLVALLAAPLSCVGPNVPESRPLWVPDNGDGTYSNPVIFADYSDPDVIRVGNDFYLVSSSFQCTPGIPVLHSHDLVNWTILGYVATNIPYGSFESPRHGGGIWAPSIRHHAGKFYVYFGDPDYGIFCATAENPAGPWSSLLRVRQAKGWIDPCPLWDDDGNAYLVHAWSKSRAGFNSVLTVHRMSPDGLSILDDGIPVFDGHANHPTIEGPKFYKRNGFYYILAPAGGVRMGWQVALRSRSVFGPYEDRIVLAQGKTPINGPHQGGWVETASGESWFIHFQDRGPYGRITHLQPMAWKDEWPVIGRDADGDGVGEPVLHWKKPDVGTSSPLCALPTSDEFDGPRLGLAWQWHANHRAEWSSLASRSGFLRLFAVVEPESSKSLWDVPNLLLQKFPAPAFEVTVHLNAGAISPGERAGLVVMGRDYSLIAVTNDGRGMWLTRASCTNADKGGVEKEEEGLPLRPGDLLFRLAVDSAAVCTFSYCEAGGEFRTLGERFTAREGVWIGGKVGLFHTARTAALPLGHTDVDYVRFAHYAGKGGQDR